MKKTYNYNIKKNELDELISGEITILHIPDGTTNISELCFYMCSNLEKVYIPNTITSIESGAFRLCKKLKRIIFSGTKNEWNNIEKSQYWLNGRFDLEIISLTVECVDGNITI